MLIPEIDKLIDTDSQNIPLTRKVLSDFSPMLPEAINQAAVHYKTISRIFGGTA